MNTGTQQKLKTEVYALQLLSLACMLQPFSLGPVRTHMAMSLLKSMSRYGNRKRRSQSFLPNQSGPLWCDCASWSQRNDLREGSVDPEKKDGKTLQIFKRNSRICTGKLRVWNVKIPHSVEQTGLSTYVKMITHQAWWVRSYRAVAPCALCYPLL